MAIIIESRPIDGSDKADIARRVGELNDASLQGELLLRGEIQEHNRQSRLPRALSLGGILFAALSGVLCYFGL